MKSDRSNKNTNVINIINDLKGLGVLRSKRKRRRSNNQSTSRSTQISSLPVLSGLSRTLIDNSPMLKQDVQRLANERLVLEDRIKTNEQLTDHILTKVEDGTFYNRFVDNHHNLQNNLSNIQSASLFPKSPEQDIEDENKMNNDSINSVTSPGEQAMKRSEQDGTTNNFNFEDPLTYFIDEGREWSARFDRKNNIGVTTGKTEKLYSNELQFKNSSPLNLYSDMNLATAEYGFISPPNKSITRNTSPSPIQTNSSSNSTKETPLLDIKKIYNSIDSIQKPNLFPSMNDTDQAIVGESEIVAYNNKQLKKKQNLVSFSNTSNDTTDTNKAIVGESEVASYNNKQLKKKQNIQVQEPIRQIRSTIQQPTADTKKQNRSISSNVLSELDESLEIEPEMMARIEKHNLKIQLDALREQKNKEYNVAKKKQTKLFQPGELESSYESDLKELGRLGLSNPDKVFSPKSDPEVWNIFKKYSNVANMRTGKAISGKALVDKVIGLQGSIQKTYKFPPSKKVPTPGRPQSTIRTMADLHQKASSPQLVKSVSLL